MKITLTITFILLLYLYEYFAPLRKRSLNKETIQHALNHTLLIVLGNALSKGLIFILTYSGINYFDYQGIFKRIEINYVFKTIILLIIFDFLIWLQHLLFHKIKILWRFHSVHHTDLFLDTSTGVRFHPGEILFSSIYKVLIIIFLGIDNNTFILCEILLTLSSLFHHSNIYIPPFLDKKLSLFIVTPNFHQVHHSHKRLERDANYGFILTLWDSLFKINHDYHHIKDHLKIGLNNVSENEANSFKSMLFSPFLTKN